MTGREPSDLERLTARVNRLEASVSESRRLHQRLCDLVDVVTEVLVPATDADARLLEALARLTRSLGDSAPTGGQRSL